MNTDSDPLTEACRKRVGAMPGGKWRLDALIGVGGMAAVYAATHRNGNRAALKILHPEYAGHAEIRSRFLREAYIANKIDHPGTVKVLDDDVTDEGEPYLVMELLAGESVQARAKRNGGWLRFAEVVDIVEQVLGVLEKAHAAGVVHRDLKPDNLFVTTKGEAKVLDFGIARIHDAATANRTQTGLMMGTPAYMAPEQALGKWSDVDGRTDLWSLGAVFYTLLSGKTVHEGETENEIFIRAATRPAPSFARAVPNAPVEVVRVVDRALSFEREKRFPDASTMREAVRALRGAFAASPSVAPRTSEAPTRVGTSSVPVPVRSQAPPAASMPAPARSQAPPAASNAPPATSVRAPARSEPAPRRSRPPDGASEAYDAAYATDEDLAAMTELFVEMERALIAKTQYGEEHPEAKRRLSRAFSVCASALMGSEYGLVWNVTPYSFVAREKTLWEPSAPFDRIAYQLFADGVRTLGFLPGLEDREFSTFLRLVTLDRMSEVAPEDDFVTLLWDLGFDHVVHQAIDTYAEGDQERRVRFETERQSLVDGAHAGSDADIAESWNHRVSAPPELSLADKQRRIVTFLSTGRVTTETLARVEDMKVAQERLAPLDPSILEIDDALRLTLAARLSMESGDLSERFVFAVARAFEDGASHGTGAAVATPLRYAIDGLAKSNPVLAIDMVGTLCADVGRALAPDAAKLCRGNLAAAVVSESTMRAVLESLASPAAADRDRFSAALRTILDASDDAHFSVVLAHVGGVTDSALRDLFVAYLARVGEGHETEMGELFGTADLELGLALVRILANIKSRAAREAISHAARSPHAVVRIEALGHVEGVSSERLRLEIRALLEDKEPGVRLAALEAMAKHGIRVAGPFLVLRVRAPEFDALPPNERHQAFATLVALAPNRAESAALEVANDRRLVSTDAHEVSREIALEFLGRFGVTNETREALVELKTARLRNSDRARAAAAKALDVFESRGAEPVATASREGSAS